MLAALSPDRPLSTPALEPLVDLRRTRLELMLKVLDVDGAVRRMRGGWLATGEPWTYDAARLRRVAEARTAEQRAMREYAGTTGCRMEFLRRLPRRPGGRAVRSLRHLRRAAVRCRGVARVAGRRAGASSAARAWRSRRRRCGRPAWTRSAYRSRARSRRPSRSPPAARSAGCPTSAGVTRLRALVAPEAPDGPIPDELAGAVVEVLKAWAHGDDALAAAPGGGGRRRLPPPARAGAVAGRAHRRGRPAAAARHAGLDPRRRRRVRGATAPSGCGRCTTRSTVPPEVAAALADLDGPVLLVDDLVDSGWTMALAGRALRQAGAPGVLPLALAVAG